MPPTRRPFTALQIAGTLALSLVLPLHTATPRPQNARPANLGRGFVALPLPDHKVHLGWRLLDSDPDGVQFDLYRATGTAPATKLNARPIATTTDVIDPSAPRDVPSRYFVLPVLGIHRGQPSPHVTVTPTAAPPPHLSIPLDPSSTIQKVALADLDGDGSLDFLIKTPDASVDPHPDRWTRSPDTYKIEARLSDGRPLWKIDLGWPIERGIAYSPMVAADLDGDGRAEIALKIGEGDPRDPDGRVVTGTESLAILDGLTGQIITRTAWPQRRGFDSDDPAHAYTLASINQLAVAFLDGQHPALIAVRGGTTGLIRVAAYSFRRGHLAQLWTWENRDAPASFWAAAAPRIQGGDLDDDGRDEVLLGTFALTADGAPLWSLNLSHPTHVYAGDLDPARPGLEIYCASVPPGKRATLCLAEAFSGKILWRHDASPDGIVGPGLCSDLLASTPGWESFAGADPSKPAPLRDARGESVSGTALSNPPPLAALWDDDPQRELLAAGKLSKADGTTLAPAIEGRPVAIADLFGDWREEILTALPGELRIYHTPIPARDRRFSLLCDPLYHLQITVSGTGQYQLPTLSIDPATGRRIPIPREAQPDPDSVP